MKKASLGKIALVGPVLAIWLAFFIPSVHAQAPVLIFGQGQVNEATSTGSSPGSNFSQSVGLGISGRTGTIESVTLFGTIQTIADDSATVYIEQSTTTNFSISPIGSCVFDSAGLDGPISGFLQLTHIQSVSGYGCTIQASSTVKVTLQLHTLSGTNPFSVINGSFVNNKGWNWCSPSSSYFCGSGGSATSSFMASFGLIGNSFSLVPTTTDSGLLFSGAFSYCNDVFASTTGIGATIANGMCIALGYLFIPTPASVSQFGNFTSTLQSTQPFSYYYDVSDIINGQSASSTANFTALSVDLRATGVGSTSPWGQVLPQSFAYLSSTTIMTYINPTLYDLLFLLMRFAIWITVLFHFYHRIVPRKPTI